MNKYSIYFEQIHAALVSIRDLFLQHKKSYQT